MDHYGNSVSKEACFSGPVTTSVVPLVESGDAQGSFVAAAASLAIPTLSDAVSLHCEQGLLHVDILHIEPECVGSDGRYELRFQHTGFPNVAPFTLRFLFANNAEKLVRQNLILQQKARVEQSIVKLKDLAETPLRRLAEVKTLLYDGTVKVNILQTELQANVLLFVIRVTFATQFFLFVNIYLLLF